ncbi:MAG TPA: hypothetical protein QGI30_04240, partial [Anaerolineales bacterium]|nr:hypothetical protein [Anaerolineales bacterium]
LQLYDADTESWRGHSEAGIRQTQRKIDALLRIDYETFMNSAFIAQGRADEFTVKSAGDRKAVLASILGLEQWTLFEQHARDRGVALTEDVRVLEREIAAIDVELQRRAEYEQELSDAESGLNQVLEQLRAAEKDMADVEQARQGLAHARRSTDDLNDRLKQGESELADAEKELAAAQTKGDDEALRAEQAAAQSELEALDEREHERKQLAADRAEAAESAARLQGENEILIAEAEPLKQRIAALQAAMEPICPTCGQALDEGARAQLLTDLQGDLDTRRERYAEQREQYQKLTAQLKALDKSLAELEKALKQKPGLQRKLAELGSAVAGAAAAHSALAGLQKRRQRWQDTLAQDRAQVQQLQLEARKHELQLQAADERRQALERLRIEHRVATEHVGSARQKLAALDGLAQRRESRSAGGGERAGR